MMKIRVFIITIVLICASGCTSNSPVMDSKGPVASITSFNKNDIKTRLVTYYRNGKIAEELSYNDDGSISDRITYRYDDDYLLLEKFDSASNDRYLYSYDENGRQVLEVNEDNSGRFETRSHYSAGGTMKIDSTTRHGWINIHELDDEGRTVEWWQLNAAGDTIGHAISTYDEQGRDLEYLSYDEGKFFNWKKYTYYDEGDLHEEIILLEDGSIKHKYIHKYYDDGSLLEVKREKADGVVDFTLQYHTDKDGFKYCTTFIPGIKEYTTKELLTYFPVAGQ